ncbi:hypothetical protein SAMN04487830_10182 [Pseudobutyrivibrio sp. OR37]|uniref:zinc-ribbon domain-containing protein n=1 Tax=Pseudobutyrivibrio sp. OR37 TaxID=1798186 RepID=UPI0008E1789D|nr:zinc-ribbon domain-containing protein [Pseudobutyrivibrio sp. OR37]SFH53002.1 hypothetical protein SAMN04487830_10182 [Pseudobutyrivibrio sp. OR37]
MAFCIKCGAELSPDVERCYKCGYPVVLRSQQSEEQELKIDKEQSTIHNMKSILIVIKKYLPIVMLVIFICIIGTVYYFNPNTQYNIAEKAFSNESYSKAIKCYKRAGTYKDAADKLDVAIKAFYYSKGQSLYEENNDEAAINAASNYANAVGYSDSYDKAMQICDMLVNKGDYDNARIIYEMLNENDYVQYCLGMDALKKSNYAFAKNKLGSARNILDGDEQYKEAVYNYAITQVNSKNFEEALDELLEITDYKDVNDYINSISVAYSKEEIELGNLNHAIKLIENVPDNSQYEDVKASDIKMLLENNKDWAKVCGTWICTSGKMKATQDGSYSSYWWYHDFNEGDLSIDIRCSLKADNSVILMMKGDIPIYTEYSVVGELVEKDLYSLTSNINVEKQGKIELDNNASITVTPSKLTFNYKKVDKSQDVFFNYIYTTDITFGTMIESF